MDPVVSIIMAVKNGARFVTEALQSIYCQTYQSFEIFVIDGHSTDKTADLVKSFSRVHYFLQPNEGIACANNYGISLAKGKYVAFLSHDDLWTPNKLELQVQALESNFEKSYSIARAKFFLDQKENNPKGFRKELLTQERLAPVLETLLAKRLLFDQIGGFDPLLSTAEDVDWFARAQDLEISSLSLPFVLLHKRIHDQNTALNNQTNNQNILQALRNSLHRKKQVKYEFSSFS